MNGQRLTRCAVFLLLKITCFHVSAKQNYIVPEQWTLKDMPFLPIIFAKSKYLPEGPCKEDTHRFLRALLNDSMWAAQMFDSSTKYPEGILYGHTRHLGNFDECYNLHVNIAEENAKKITNIREIDGKYCLVNIEYRKKHATLTQLKLSKSKYQNDSFNMNKSFWKFIEQREDGVHVRRNRLLLALCVPATCNAENVKTALRIPLEKLGASKNVELRTTVQSCQTAKEVPKYTLGAVIYCAVLLGLLSLVIICTWYDSVSSKDEKHTFIIPNIILCFSAQRNYVQIFDTNYTHTGLDSIHFIRLAATVCTVYMHNLFLYSTYMPTTNAVDMEKIYSGIPFITIFINAIVTMNIFFAISGVLLASRLLKDLDRYKQLNFVKNVASRYLRLTPVYATLIGLCIWILPQLYPAPLWHYVAKDSNYCVKNWWTNLLYINNYLTSSELCLLHGWYLAADFQLFVCSLFVIYAFWCMPRKIGYVFLGILTLISCIVQFVATYIYGASSVLRITPTTTDIRDIPEFAAYYIKGHICATGYLVGIIAGAILHDHKNSTWRLCKFWSHILVLPLPLILYISIQYWAHKFFILDKTNLLEEAIFAFFQRLIPALCVCSTIVLLSVDTGLESYYNFFTPRWIQPLSNLCFGVYMVHILLIANEIRSYRTATTFNIGNTIWTTIPLLVVSFLFSLLLAICIEMPYRNLAKWLFSERSKTVVKENNTMVVNIRMSESKILKRE